MSKLEDEKSLQFRAFCYIIREYYFFRKGKKIKMKNLYGSIKISKILGKDKQSIEENIDYYKLKDDKYGLEIVKRNSTNEENIEVTNIADITDNEEKIDSILNELVIKEITPELSDVIEDLLKTYV